MKYGHTYLLTYLLTYSTVQSPWAANWFTASREIPRISQNPKVHYCTHKRPPPVSILGQPSPVHIPTSHLLKIHPNIIHPSTPMSPQWPLSLRFPHQDPIHHPLLTHRSIVIIRILQTHGVSEAEDGGSSSLWNTVRFWYGMMDGVYNSSYDAYFILGSFWFQISGYWTAILL